MGSDTRGAPGNWARLMSELECTTADKVRILAGDGEADWRAQPGAVTTSVSAIPDNRLTCIVARYMVTRTYAKTTLTLPTVLPRFVRPRNSWQRRTGLG